MSPELKSSHELSLTIDPKLSANGGVSDIRIATDHPNQREVTISVHVSSNE